MAKLKATIGIGVTIVNKGLKIRLRRRIEHDSIQPGQDYFGCWEAPILALQESQDEKIPYDYLLKGLSEGVMRETGLNISESLNARSLMPSFFALPFKNNQGDYDLLLAMHIFYDSKKDNQPENGESKWFSFEEFLNLASSYKPPVIEKGKIVQSGQGLLSGLGRRQDCAVTKAYYECLRSLVPVPIERLRLVGEHLSIIQNMF
jgi:hypothetical protein